MREGPFIYSIFLIMILGISFMFLWVLADLFSEPGLPNFDLTYESVNQEQKGAVYYIPDKQYLSLDDVYRINNQKRNDMLAREMIRTEVAHERGENIKIIVQDGKPKV